LGLVGKPDVYGNVFLALDGTSVAVDKTDISTQNTSDVWTYQLAGEKAMRLTFSSGLDMVPVWSPDSTRFVLTSNRQINQDLYIKKSDGTQEEKLVVHANIDVNPNDWSRDGKYILYTAGNDLWYLMPQDLKTSLFLTRRTP